MKDWQRRASVTRPALAVLALLILVLGARPGAADVTGPETMQPCTAETFTIGIRNPGTSTQAACGIRVTSELPSDEFSYVAGTSRIRIAGQPVATLEPTVVGSEVVWDLAGTRLTPGNRIDLDLDLAASCAAQSGLMRVTIAYVGCNDGAPVQQHEPLPILIAGSKRPVFIFTVTPTQKPACGPIRVRVEVWNVGDPGSLPPEDSNDVDLGITLPDPRYRYRPGSTAIGCNAAPVPAPDPNEGPAGTYHWYDPIKLLPRTPNMCPTPLLKGQTNVLEFDVVDTNDTVTACGVPPDTLTIAIVAYYDEWEQPSTRYLTDQEQSASRNIVEAAYPPLTVTKTVTPLTCVPGVDPTATWTITVTNPGPAGPADVDWIRIVDTLGAGLTHELGPTSPGGMSMLPAATWGWEIAGPAGGAASSVDIGASIDRTGAGCVPLSNSVDVFWGCHEYDVVAGPPTPTGAPILPDGNPNTTGPTDTGGWLCEYAATAADIEPFPVVADLNLVALRSIGTLACTSDADRDKSFTFQFEIRNDGTAAVVTDFDLAVVDDLTPATTIVTTFVAAGGALPIAPGATAFATVSFPWDCQQPPPPVRPKCASPTFTATVNATAGLCDCNSSNDSATATYSTAAIPDLRVRSVTPIGCAGTGTIRVDVSIENAGCNTPAIVTNFAITVTDDSTPPNVASGTFTGFGGTLPFGPGTSPQTITVPMPAGCPGPPGACPALTYTATLDTGNAICECSGSNSGTSAPFANPLVDLVLSNLAAASDCPVGADATITFDVENRGCGTQTVDFAVEIDDGIAPPFTVSFLSLTGGSLPLVPGIPQSVSYGGLPGDCTACVGTGSLTVTLDPLAATCECDTTNNSGTTTVGSIVPDLTLANLVATTSCPVAADATVTFDVANVGCGAQTVDFGVRLDDGVSPPITVLFSTLAGASLPLAAGATQTVSYAGFPGDCGNCTGAGVTLTVTIDPAGTNCECDATNNVATAAVTSTVPDLTLRNLAAATSCPGSGDATITFDVENVGCGDQTTDFDVRFDDGVGPPITIPFSTLTGATLPLVAGVPQAVSYDGFPGDCADCLASRTLTVTLDPTAASCECVTTNNVTTAPIGSTVPDLTIANTTAVTSCPAGDATITFDISNVGCGPQTADFSVEINDGVTAPVIVLFSTLTGATLPLAAGATQTVSYAGFPGDCTVCVGRRLTVAIDPAAAACECNVSNNTDSTTVDSTVPDLALRNLTAVTGCPTGDATITFDVRNVGCGDQLVDFDVQFDDGGAPVTVPFSTLPGASLPLVAGATQTITYGGFPGACADCSGAATTLTVRLNPTGASCECAVANNVATTPITSTVPDLTLTGLTAMTSCPGSGNATITFDLANVGCGDQTTDFDVRLDDGVGPPVTVLFSTLTGASLPLVAGTSQTVSYGGFPGDCADCTGTTITLTVTIDPSGTVCECTPTNNTASAPLGSSVPDLAVANLTAITSCPGSGDATVTFDLQNVGCGDQTTDFDVEIDDGVGPPVTVLFSSLTGASLPLVAGGSQTVTYDGFPSDCRDCVGTRTLAVAIDPRAAVCECDATNNRTTTTVGSTVPDLTVANLTAVTSCPGTGTAAITFDLSNVGCGDQTTDFDVELDDGVGPPITVLFSSLTGASLPLLAGATQSVSYAGFPGDCATCTGGRTLTLTVNPVGASCECDPANNTTTATMTSTVPDLELANLTALTSCPGGNDATVTFDVRNVGCGDQTTDFSVEFDDGVGPPVTVAFSTLSGASLPLAAGTSQSVSYDRFAADCSDCAGTAVTLTVTIDPAGAACECDPTNNSLTTSIASAVPDLTVTSTTTTPDCPGGSGATVTSTVANVGCGPQTTDFEIQIGDGVSTVTRWFRADFGGPLPFVPGATFVVVSAGFPADCSTCAGTAITVTVDPTDAVCECDETNNDDVSVLVNTVPDLAITAITPITTCGVDGATAVDLTVTVANLGCGDVTIDFDITLTDGATSVTRRFQADLGGPIPFVAGARYSFTEVGFPAACASCALTFTVTADPTDAVCECGSLNNTAVSAPFPLDVPDLVVTADTLDLVCDPTGSRVTGTITVANAGCGTFTGILPASISLHTGAGCLSADLERWDETAAVVLAPGTDTTLIVDHVIGFALCTAGTELSLAIELDRVDATCECTAGNNRQCGSVSTGLRDTAVTAVTPNFSCAGTGDTSTGTVTFVVENRAATDEVTDFEIAISDGTSPTLTTTFVALGGLLPLVNGTPQTLTVSAWAIGCSPCARNFQVETDPNRQMCECALSDNLATSAPVTTPVADLVIRGAATRTQCAADGVAGVVDITVANVGCADLTTDFEITVASGAFREVRSFVGLGGRLPIEPGGARTVTMEGLELTCDSCDRSYGVSIDAGGICQCDDTDAATAVGLSITVPEMAATAIEPSLTCALGGRVDGTVLVKVENTGCGASEATVTLEWDDGSEPLAIEPLLIAPFPGAIAAGSYSWFTYQVTDARVACIDCSLTFRASAKAIADCECEVADDDGIELSWPLACPVEPPGRSVEIVRDEGRLACCLLVDKKHVASRASGDERAVEQELYFEPASALYLAAELTRLSATAGNALEGSGAAGARFSRFNLGSLTMLSGLGLDMTWAPDLAPSAGQAGSAAAVTARLAALARAEGLAEVPAIRPILLELAGGVPAYQGAAELGELAWERSSTDAFVRIGGIGAALLSQSAELPRLLASDDPRARFFGAVMTWQMTQKIAFLHRELAAGAASARGLAREYQHVPGRGLVASDPISSLADSATLLWGLSQARATLGHLDRAGDAPLDPLIALVWTSIEDRHFDPASGSYRALGRPAEGAQAIPLDAMLIARALASIVRDNPDLAIGNAAGDRLRTHLAFLASDMVGADGRVPAAYDLAGGKPIAGGPSLIGQASLLRALLLAESQGEAALRVNDYLQRRLWDERWGLYRASQGRTWTYTPHTVGAVVGALSELVPRLPAAERTVIESRLARFFDKVVNEAGLQLRFNRFVPHQNPLALHGEEDPDRRSRTPRLLSSRLSLDTDLPIPRRDLAPVFVRQVMVEGDPDPTTDAGDRVDDGATPDSRVGAAVVATMNEDRFRTATGMLATRTLGEVAEPLAVLSRGLDDPFAGDPVMVAELATLLARTARAGLVHVTTRAGLGVPLVYSETVQALARDREQSPQTALDDWLQAAARDAGLDAPPAAPQPVFLEYAAGRPGFDPQADLGWDPRFVDRTVELSAVAQGLLSQVALLRDLTLPGAGPTDDFVARLIGLEVAAKIQFLANLVADDPRPLGDRILLTQDSDGKILRVVLADTPAGPLARTALLLGLHELGQLAENAARHLHQPAETAARAARIATRLEAELPMTIAATIAADDLERGLVVATLARLHDRLAADRPLRAQLVPALRELAATLTAAAAEAAEAAAITPAREHALAAQMAPILGLNAAARALGDDTLLTAALARYRPFVAERWDERVALYVADGSVSRTLDTTSYHVSDLDVAVALGALTGSAQQLSGTELAAELRRIAAFGRGILDDAGLLQYLDRNPDSLARSYDPVLIAGVDIIDRVGRTRAFPGDILTFAVEVANVCHDNSRTTGPLRDIIVRETLPKGLLYIAGSSSQNGERTAEPFQAGGALTWRIPILKESQRIVVGYQARVEAELAPSFLEGQGQASGFTLDEEGEKGEYCEAEPAPVAVEIGRLARFAAEAYLDADANGARDAGEELLDNMRIVVNGRPPAEARAASDAIVGQVTDIDAIDLESFMSVAVLGDRVPPGLYQVGLDLAAVPSDLVPTTPLVQSIRLAEGDDTTVRFGLTRLQQVRGHLFDDRDGDGNKDWDEPGIAAAEVRLAGTEHHAYTTADGNLSIDGTVAAVGTNLTLADAQPFFDRAATRPAFTSWQERQSPTCRMALARLRAVLADARARTDLAAGRRLEHDADIACNVTLRGHVPDAAAQAAIEGLVRAVPGLAEVTNELWVGQQTTGILITEGHVDFASPAHQVTLELGQGIAASVTETAVGDLDIGAPTTNPAALRMRVGANFAAASPGTELSVKSVDGEPTIHVRHGHVSLRTATACLLLGDTGATTGPSLGATTVGALELPRIPFEVGRATLGSEGLVLIDCLSELLRAHPELAIRVEGHTDSYDSPALNVRLSQQRAEAVRDALVARGLVAGRFEVEALGEGRPLSNNATSEGRTHNRRVELSGR